MLALTVIVLLLGHSFADRLSDVVGYYETVDCQVETVGRLMDLPSVSGSVQSIRVKRDVDRFEGAATRNRASTPGFRIKFAAFNRSFDLQLNSVDLDEILSPDFEVTDASGRRQATRSDFTGTFVRGANTIDGATVSGMIDVSGQFRGVVVSPDGDGEYHIEPGASYLPDSLTPTRSIVYRMEPDHTTKKRSKRSLKSFCGLSNPELRNKLENITHLNVNVNVSSGVSRPESVRHAASMSWASELAHDASLNRFRRSPDTNTKHRRLEKRVCHLSVTTDVYFWEMVRKRSDIRDDAHARSEIALLVSYLIAEVKRIYEATAFSAFSNRQYDDEKALEYSYSGVTFRLQRLKVLTSTACPNGWLSVAPGATAASAGSNVHCMQNVDVATLLGAFSESEKDRNAVCLAYLFTARDFSGTLGMAYVARAADARNGVCSAALNTGLISFKNYGALQTSAMSALTLAHELGHNFGAEHDEDSPQCAPGSRGHAAGNYIMFYSASADGAASNNRQFSPCSRDAIARVLNHLVTSPTAGNCLEKDDSAFCGNEQREEGEECDCGVWADCADKCCWPADTEPNILRCRLRRNNTASVKPAQTGAPLGGAVCSPQQGACCSPNCGLLPRNSVCARESQCASASLCSGLNATCPRGKPKPDGIPCSVDSSASPPFSKSCYQGECRRSICHAIANLTECQLEIAEAERRKPRNPEQYCFVACAVQPSTADGVLEDCVSSYEWFVATRNGDSRRLDELATRYPLMHRLVTREANGSGIQLPPGSPCSNGRGYCDVFRKCRVIDVDGPLKYLQKLLFSADSLVRVANWLLSNWWYAILILVGTIITMGFFVKYCSVHTRSSNPEFTRAVRAANMRERLAHRVSNAYQTLRSRVSRTPRAAHVAPSSRGDREREQRQRPRPAAGPSQAAAAQAPRRSRREEGAARRRNNERDRRSQPSTASGSRADSQRDVTVPLDSTSSGAGAGRPVSLIVASSIGESAVPVSVPYNVVYTAPATVMQNPLAHASGSGGGGASRSSPPPAYAEVERDFAAAVSSSGGGSAAAAKSASNRPKSPPRIGPGALLPNAAAQNLPPHGRGKRAGASNATAAPKSHQKSASSRK